MRSPYLRRAAALLALTTCSRAAPEPTAEPQAVVAAAALPTTTVSDQPHLQLAARPSAIDHGKIELTAGAVLRDADAVYVSANLGNVSLPDVVRFTVTASTHGIAAANSGNEEILVRFSGKDLPESFDIAWEGMGTEVPVAERGVLHVTMSKKPTVKRTLRNELFAALSAWFRSIETGISGVDSFYAFASDRAMLTSANGKVPQYAPTSEMEDAMALYTGASSLRDALQTERALHLKRTGKRTLPIADLTPPRVTEHDWAKLIRELALPATVEPLAASVPAGMIYLHAPSAKQLSTTVHALSERLLGIIQARDIDTGGGDVTERYATQLALEHSPVTSALADTAIDGIAIASSDPFFREGTDVTVAFHVTNASLLDAGLARKEQEIATRYGAARSTYKIGARDVALTATADGKVNRHQVKLDDTILVSNSRKALERFIAVRDSKAPSIASGGDFTYMRSLYPYDRSKEDAFAFIGDAFVAHVISPGFKIAAARRVHAIADAQALNYAAMYYAWLNGRAPQSTDEMLKSKVIERSDLVTEDAQPLVFDRYRGTQVVVKPLLDETIDKITQEERDAYTSFASSYEMLWSKIIDPAAVRIVAHGGTIALDVRMLPIVNRGDYQDVEALAGSSRVTAPTVRNGVAWVSAVGPDASLRREVEGTGRTFMGKDFQLGWLGNWVMAGLADRAGAYDMAIASGALGPAVSDEDTQQVGPVPPSWRAVLQHAPVFIGAEVNNPVALAAVLTGLRRIVEGAAPGLVEWATEEPFEGQPVSVIREGANGLPVDQRIAIRYTTLNSVFVASLDRSTLVEQLTAIKDNRSPKSAASEKKRTPGIRSLEESAQTTLDYVPAADSWLAKVVNIIVQRALERKAVRRQYAELALRPYLRDIGDASQQASVTSAFLGASAASEDDAMTASLAKLKRISARMSIEGDDEHRGLHTSVTLTE